MLTREEYKAKYGIDPAEAAPVPVDDASGGLKPDYFAKSVVTGALTIPTDFINLGPTVYAAGKAAWNAAGTDKTWADEFQKNIMVEDAQKNVQEHINTIGQSWKQSNPELTDEQINAGLADYQKSKRFEDFMMEQKSGTHYLAAKAKDAVRHLLGDQRTEKQQSWTDTAGEVIGGALVPGPSWTAAGVRGGLAAVPYVGAVANSLPGRVALKTAELTTPLTMPYSGVNVAANAAVGIGIDQAARYALDKPTAFTPTKEDSAGVGTLGGIAAGVGALATIVGAVRGRSAAALQAAQMNPSHIEQTLRATPTVDYRVREGDTTGQTIISGGPPTQYGPGSSMDAMPWHQQARRTARNQYIDQNAAVLGEIRDIHGISVADDLERRLGGNSGPVLADAIPARVSKSMQSVLDAEAGMTPDQLRAVKQAHWMNSYSSDISTTLDALNTEIAELNARLQRGRANPQALAATRNELAQKQSDLQRLIADDPSARPRLPEIEMSKVHRMGTAFEAGTEPFVVQYRNAVKQFNRDMLDLDVASGRLSQEAADNLHKRNPFYVQAKDDPFKGATGADRMWQSITQSVRSSMTRQSAGTGAGALSESPLRHLSLDVQPIKPIGAPETRITNAFDTTSTMQMYARRTHIDHAHTVARNELLRALHTDKNGNPSDLVRDGKMRAVDNGRGGTWWEGNQLRTPELQAKLDSPNVVDEWSNGKVRLWEFGDPEYARALRMEPVMMAGLMKGVAMSSNLAKSMITGRLAPWFAPTGAMYNMMMAVMTRHHTRAFGPLSTALHRWTPEWFAKQVGGKIPDVTALARWPYDVVASLVELQAFHLTRPIARELAKITPFAALQQAVGPRTYQRMVNTMLKVAHWADQSPAATLYKAGATFGQQTVDNIPAVRTAFTQMKVNLPLPLRKVWQFYTDTIDSIWLAEKRQYYTQNHALLSSKHNGNIPQRELDRIIDEARTLAGDMSLQPASTAMRNLETALPYLTQAKLSTYHLLRNMTSRDTMWQVNPRLMITMMGVGSSIYWMTYWNDESRKEYWERTPEHERLKHIYIPSPTLLLAWSKGENPNYSRDLYYKVRVPPDFAGMIAGTAAMMQMMGILPADATPKPLSSSVSGAFIDNLMPAMPPLLQAAAAQSGMKFDPQGADTRGGNWLRNYQSMFRTGAQAESTTNLGQVSNTTTLTMQALFGTLGGYLAQGTDIMLHAAKYHPELKGNNQFVPRVTADYGEGLRRAMTNVAEKAVEKLPDVPLIWQNKERYTAVNASWKFVAENNTHIRSIVGMRDDAVGKAANAKRAAAAQAGGIPTAGMTDVVLGQISEDVAAWDRPTGAMGKLKKQYDDLVARSRAVSVQYNLPQDERQKQVNTLMMQQQDVKKQQQMAIQYAEQVIAAKYGRALQPLLRGRFINMQTVDELIRENIGNPAAAHATAREPQQQSQAQ